MKKVETAKTILLVEDDALIALAEKMTLEWAGYSGITAGTGEKAVEIACDGSHSIDLGSGMSGTDAATRILTHRELPIAFLPSHTEPGVVEQTEGITSYGCIAKKGCGLAVAAPHDREIPAGLQREVGFSGNCRTHL